MNTIPDAAPAREETPPGFRWHGGESQSWRETLSELWQHRDLLWLFALRDLQVRYRQTWAGIVWAVIQPAAALAIFTLLFGLLGRVPTDRSAPYYLFVWCGLLPWQFFQAVVSASTRSLVTHRALITKVWFPRPILPLSTMLAPAVDFAVSAGILLIALIWEGRIGPQIVLAPLFLLIAVVAAAACGLALSAMNALYRDAEHAVPLALMVGMYLSPVVYQVAAIVPAEWQWVWSLNPLVAAIEGLRFACLGTPCPSAAVIALGAGVAALGLCGAWRLFRSVEDILVDRI